MWMSRAELRLSDLNICGSKKQDSEWLCCCAIKVPAIKAIYPFDGDTVHKKGYKLVKGLASIEKYYFNWDERRWIHNPNLTNFRPFRNATEEDKRKRDEDDDVRPILMLLGLHMKRVRKQARAQADA